MWRQRRGVSPSEMVLDPLSYLVLALVVLLYLFRVITWTPSRA